MQCMRCRRVIPDDAVFCCYCGVRMEGAPAAQRRRRRRPRGTGSVWKDARNKSRPFVAVAADGTRIGTFATSGEAVKALDDVNASKISPERQTYTLADVYDRWSELHYPKITVKAQQSYANAYRKAAALHDRRIAELKTEDYQRVLSQMMTAGASRSLCEKERQLFSQLCQYAINQDIIHTNYSTALVLPEAGAPKRAFERRRGAVNKKHDRRRPPRRDGENRAHAHIHRYALERAAHRPPGKCPRRRWVSDRRRKDGGRA